MEMNRRVEAPVRISIQLMLSVDWEKIIDACGNTDFMMRSPEGPIIIYVIHIEWRINFFEQLRIGIRHAHSEVGCCGDLEHNIKAEGRWIPRRSCISNCLPSRIGYLCRWNIVWSITVVVRRSPKPRWSDMKGSAAAIGILSIQRSRATKQKNKDEIFHRISNYLEKWDMGYQCSKLNTYFVCPE